MATLIASLVFLLALEATGRWLPKKYTDKHEKLVLKLKTLLKRWKFTFEVAEKLAGVIKLLKLVGRLIISIVPMVLNWLQ
ncbi:MAG: hypothetical protein IPN76_14160 [Saprospiraceae bacterium]|nr:hypothetical protein [Saprospiraceae bacterium]